MKKAIGNINISYDVECPYCEESSYSDVCSDDGWEDLEYGDGTPHGKLTCGECKKEFEIEIEG